MKVRYGRQKPPWVLMTEFTTPNFQLLSVSRLTSTKKAHRPIARPMKTAGSIASLPRKLRSKSLWESKHHKATLLVVLLRKQ